MNTNQQPSAPQPAQGGWSPAKNKAFGLLVDVESGISAARHQVDLIWSTALDLCKENPDFNRAETPEVINTAVYDLLQGLWCSEGYIDDLRDLIREAELVKPAEMQRSEVSP